MNKEQIKTLETAFDTLFVETMVASGAKDSVILGILGNSEEDRQLVKAARNKDNERQKKYAAIIG